MIIKDAFWQILGRIVSAIWWFIVLKYTTPFLWPLRFGDYNTILRYFAFWSALADLWLYVIALKEIWNLKKSIWADDIKNITNEIKDKISIYYSKFVTSRIFNAAVVFGFALIAAYFIPAYTKNIYLIYGLPIWAIFAATFMLSGIVQIPLQLYWKMEHTSIALLIARISQIIFIISIVYIFRDTSFDTVNDQNLVVFLLVMWSVLISGLAQYIYTQYVANKFIKFRWIWDREFTKKHIIDNGLYGLSYFFSSFHILLTGFLLWVFFPTIDWFIYAWIWWLAMQLLEILLIIPSSVGNSLIHKISSNTDEEKQKAYGGLMIFLIRLWWLIAINFSIFSQNIINFTSWTKYITQFLWWQTGSDYILMWLWIVVILTFVKQTYNYIMVSFNHQNKLFWVNGIWLAIWWWLWIYLIQKYNVDGWIITQILLEVLYVLWWIYIWFRYKINPIINWKRLIYIIGILWLMWLWWSYVYKYIWADYHIWPKVIIMWIIFNIIILWLNYIPIKKTLREMGQ